MSEKKIQDIVANPIWNMVFNIMAEPDVAEVVANGPNKFFVTRRGRRMPIEFPRTSEEAYNKSILDGLVPHVNTENRYENATYIHEGKLVIDRPEFDIYFEGRCHIELPPEVDVPQITITKKTKSLLTLDAIAGAGSMSTEMLSFLKAAVAANLTIAISGKTGAGKALHLDTMIPTLNGFKTVEEIQVGEVLFDENGDRTVVVKKYCPMDPESFEIKFNNGQKLKTSAGHLWEVELLNANLRTHPLIAERLQSTRAGNDVVLSTKEIFELGKDNFAIRKLEGPVDYSGQDLPVAPSVLAMWLAGNHRRMKSPLPAFGADPVAKADLEDGYVPELYKTSGLAQRLELLDFLLKGNSNILEDGRVEFFTHHPTLTVDVREIAISLGYRVFDLESNPCDRTQDREIANVISSFTFRKDSLDDADDYILFEVLEHIDDDPADYFCFQVDSPSHLFLATESFIPTHNTTMLEALTKLWDNNERIGVAEDVPELNLIQPNVSYSHSEPLTPDKDPSRIADLTFLVRQWQRKRLTKGIIGETRGPEFSEFLVAANSGLEGSITTLHANDPIMCLDKMTRFAIKGSPGQPIRSINNEIGSTIDLIIQLQSIKGRHRVSHIAEITNTVSDASDARLATQTIYSFDRKTSEFVKENTITDALRDKFIDAEVNISTILSSNVGTRAGAHALNSARELNTDRPVEARPTQSPRRPSGGLPMGREI